VKRAAELIWCRGRTSPPLFDPTTLEVVRISYGQLVSRAARLLSEGRPVSESKSSAMAPGGFRRVGTAYRRDGTNSVGSAAPSYYRLPRRRSIFFSARLRTGGAQRAGQRTASAGRSSSRADATFSGNTIVLPAGVIFRSRRSAGCVLAALASIPPPTKPLPADSDIVSQLDLTRRLFSRTRRCGHRREAVPGGQNPGRPVPALRRYAGKSGCCSDSCASRRERGHAASDHAVACSVARCGKRAIL